MEKKVYITVYETVDGVEIRKAPEHGVGLEEAIKFLENCRP